MDRFMFARGVLRTWMKTRFPNPSTEAILKRAIKSS